MVIMGQTLTIAIPARDEPLIQQTLLYLADAVSRLPADVAVETIVCINGSTDNTKSLAEALLDTECGQKLNLQVIESAPGKTVAQQEILRQRKYTGPVISHDADVLVNPEGIAAIYEAISNKQGLGVVYAQIMPIIDPANSTPLQTIYRDVYESRRQHMRARPWVHGRIHGMTAEAADLVMQCHDNIEWRTSRVEHHPFAEKLQLHRGPASDDKLVTRLAYHAAGPESIRKIPAAQASFIPPASVAELYWGVRRSVMELERLDILFPEHAYIQRQLMAEVKVSETEMFGRARAGAVTPRQMLHLDFAHRLEDTLAAMVLESELHKTLPVSAAEQIHDLLQHPVLSEKHPITDPLRVELANFLHLRKVESSSSADAEGEEIWIPLTSTKMVSSLPSEIMRSVSGAVGRGIQSFSAPLLAGSPHREILPQPVRL